MRSKKLQTLEAGVALPADNDVVVDGDTQRAGGIHDLPGHVDIRPGGRRIARGVVVHQDDGAGGELQRPLHHLTDVHGRVIHGAALLHLVGDQPVLLVEKEDAKLLLRLEAIAARQ